MIKYFLSLFAWKTVFYRGCYQYSENTITGQRRAIKVMTEGHSPLDVDWLNHTQLSLGTPPHGKV